MKGKYELCPKCGHPWWEHDRKKDAGPGKKRFGCGANVDNLGASWAVEPGPCGCREIWK